jgi:hypothetical protein
MNFQQDTRGQPLALALFFITVVAIILVYMFLNDPFMQFFDFAEARTTNETAMTGLEWQRTVWNSLPFVFIAISGFGLLVISIYRSRV